MTLLKPDTRILIVEDEIWAQQFFLRTLQEWEYSQIMIEGNGLSGVEKAREYVPHLIFMDTYLPGIMGYEACQRIRAESWGKQMGIIAMSNAWSSQWDHASSDGFIHKDLFYRADPELDAKIQEVLKKYF